MGVYIVGMHRSGTSALAALASRLGDFPVNRLAGASNPGGHWERGDMRPPLELLLADNGSTWMHPPESSHVIRSGRLAQPYLARSFRRLARGPFLWKDPRLCLTIDFWLAQPQAEAKIVFVHRSAGEVAASLARRDGWSLERGEALWALTNHNALVRLAGHEAFVMSHADLMADPVGVARALQSWLGLAADEDSLRSAAALVRPALSSPEPNRLGVVSQSEDRKGIERTLAHLGFGPTLMQAPSLLLDPLGLSRLLGRPTKKELVRRRVRALRRSRQSELLEVASSD